MISIIIPVFNRHELIKNALENVFMQSLSNFEVIIIDDGSRQPYRASDFSDPRVRIIRHKQNKGAPAARNTGIQHAAGELLAFLDSDDTWLPEKLEVQSAWMYAHPHIAATTTGFYCRSQEGDSIEIPKNQKHWYRYFMQGMSLSPGTNLMVWRNVMLDHLYDESYPRLEDLDWALRVAKEHPFHVIPQPLAVINRGKRPSAQVMEASDLLLLEKHKHDFLKQGCFYGRQCIGKRYLEIATHYFREGKKKNGFHYLWETLKQNPFQRATMYLRILDYLLGTNMITFLKGLRAKLQNKGLRHD